MANKYFSFGDVLSYGWSVMARNFWFFVGLGIIYLMVSYITTIIQYVLKLVNPPEPVFAILNLSMIILGWVITIVLSIGIIKIALSFCDEKKPALNTLFAAGGCFWRYIGAGVLYMLIVCGGFLLLVVPGIIWSIQFCYCFYFVVDKRLGPIAALKASAKTTKGIKWELFGLGIMCYFIGILGVLCLIIGMFAAYPVIIVAKALVYRQLVAQTPELAEFGIGKTQLQPCMKELPVNDNFQ